MMWRCLLCRFDTVLDDVVVSHDAHGTCICLRCYERETGSERPMSKELRRSLIRALPLD